MTERLTAGVWSRILAHALDCFVGLAAWILCSIWFLIGLWALENPPRDLLDLAVIVLAVLALGIMVVRLDGGSVGYGRAALRCLGGLLAIACLGLGYAGVLFTSERRGLADWLAGTRVVRVSSAPAVTAAAHAEMTPQGA